MNKLKIFLLGLGLSIFISCSSSANYFELEPSQSMVIVGKGPGQDAAINPYQGQASLAAVKNLGPGILLVRIQSGKEVVKMQELRVKDQLTFSLNPQNQLYLDCQAKTKARVLFSRDSD